MIMPNFAQFYALIIYSNLYVRRSTTLKDNFIVGIILLWQMIITTHWHNTILYHKVVIFKICWTVCSTVTVFGMQWLFHTMIAYKCNYKECERNNQR